MRNNDGGKTMVPSPGEAIGIGAIADHHPDDGLECASFDGVDNRLQVRAAAGDQHTEGKGRGHACWVPTE